MKKLYVFLIFVLLSACSRPNMIETPVSRSQIYYGQTVADLYDNFGAPKRAIQYAYGVVEYTYVNDNLVSENADKHLLYCNLVVYAKDNRVIDWWGEGNNCQFQEAKVHRYLDEPMGKKPHTWTFDDD